MSVSRDWIVAAFTPLPSGSTYTGPTALPRCGAPHPKLPDRYCCRAKHHTGSCVFTPRAP